MGSLKKILVVEDEDTVRNNIIELLENENYKVLEAQNALIALDILQTEFPDLILSDIMMPYLNGFEFYEKVQNDFSDEYIPFLFLTAKMDEESLKHAMEIGADDFITKPYKADNLLKRISSRLEKKKVIDEKFEKLKLDISMYVPHELKTPLIPILGLSEMLLNDFNEFSDFQKLEMISSIYRSTHRFKERIEKFSRFTELKSQENEATEPDKEIFNIIDNSLISKLKRKYHCTERDNDIEISFTPAEIKISQADFETLVLELIENACKFSPINTLIKVRGNHSGNRYEVSIVSVGNKISKDVFEGFKQKERSRNQQIGNGLGFAIVRLIIEKYQLELSFNYDNENNNIIVVNFLLRN